MTRTNICSGYSGTSAVCAGASFACASMLMVLRLRGLVLAALIMMIIMIIMMIVPVVSTSRSEWKLHAAA